MLPMHLLELSNCLRPSRHRAHTCQKWPAGLGDNSVLCLEFRHQKMFKNKTECWPFFGFFFRRPLAFRVSKKLRNLLSKLPKISKKGGLGWFWGLLVEPLEAFGPQDGPKLKKTLKKANQYLPPWGPVGNQNLIKM